MEYIRTWSAVHAWREKYPEMKKRQEGGKGDIVDEMFDAMITAEPDWNRAERWQEKLVLIEWGSGIVLARKRDYRPSFT